LPCVESKDDRSLHDGVISGHELDILTVLC
jgi:hypothetical protein